MRKKKDLSEEFLDFLSASEIQPSYELSNKILSFVREDLNPSRSRLFMKILGIHAIVSVISLSLCSQFGFQTFPLYDAMNTFMQFMGHTYCLALCGFLYFSASSIAFSFILKPSEILAIKKDRYSQILLLTGISMGVFLCLGADVLALPSIFWAAGALVGGMGAFEFGWKIRTQLKQVIN